MADIGFEHVTKRYRSGHVAVAGLDLKVADGELMVVVGPSGCGKTTVLRMVAGLETASEGTITIGGRVVNDIPPKARDVSMVFQDYALYPQMTVAENIGFALRVREVKKAQIQEQVHKAVKMLGLEQAMGSKPAQLSGGQRQRVAMGRALVRDPSVFLMDEPLSNLDAKLRVRMRAEVMSIQRRLGVAALYVTHDQVEAMTMGDRVAVMRDGRLQQCDTPPTLYARPANVFVASFIGSPPMNLFEGVISSDGASVQVGGGILSLRGGSASGVCSMESAYRGQRVVLGVRPEHLQVMFDAQQGEAIAGRVQLVEDLGNEKLVYFRPDPSRPGLVQNAEEETGSRLGVESGGDAVARVEVGVPVRVGELFRAGIAPRHLHFFDATTGERI